MKLWRGKTTHKTIYKILGKTVSYFVPQMSIVFDIAEPCLSDLLDRKLSQNENNRMHFITREFVLNINNKMQKGGKLRDDDFWEIADVNTSKANQLLEGVLLIGKNEYENKKLIYYAKLLTNICFDKTVSYNCASLFLKLIEQLSYRQLVLLKYLYEGNVIEMGNWAHKFKNIPELEEYYDLYSEIKFLDNYKLLDQKIDGTGIKLGESDVVINSMGKKFVELLELETLSLIDIKTLTETLNNINELIINNK